MKRLILTACVMFIAGCQPGTVVDDCRDAVAVDLALATMTDDAPLPWPHPPTPYDCPRCRDTGWITHGDGHRTPCPDCRSGAGYGGPLETYRDARALIRKGNELADRGRAILDAAERDGKITVDVRLPALDRATERLCPDGVCSVAPKRAASTLCPDGICPLPNERSAPIGYPDGVCPIPGEYSECPDGICPLPPERSLSEPGVESFAPTACIRGIGRPRRWLPFRRSR